MTDGELLKYIVEGGKYFRENFIKLLGPTFAFFLNNSLTKRMKKTQEAIVIERGIPLIPIFNIKIFIIAILKIIVITLKMNTFLTLLITKK